jgi:sulfane dehydrogenase subunit SoxC
MSSSPAGSPVASAAGNGLLDRRIFLSSGLAVLGAAGGLITRPSPGVALQGPGLYEMSGIAWSGSGTITKVEVSADGGQTWAEAALSAPVLPRALTRFRIPWKWSGSPAIVKSRATDSTGETQPTRDTLVAEHGTNVVFH